MEQRNCYLAVVLIVTSVFVSSVAGGKLSCKYTRSGTEYDGTLSVTSSGKACQRWDTHSPHNHTKTDPHKFPEDNIQDAANYCRTPDGDQSGPWCYTTDPKTRWEHCNVTFCDCKRMLLGTNYQGTISITRSGRKCQRWDSQTPHAHDHDYDYKLPDDSVFDAANYCRNPDMEVGGPWCFTTDPAQRWEYCNISFCGETIRPKHCKLTEQGKEYEGTISTTLYGHQCQRWDSQSPHAHTNDAGDKFVEGNASLVANYCRNPDNDPIGPWCYTTDPATRFEHCDVNFCDCKIHQLGKGYRGELSVTKSGRTCQRWDEMHPHTHSLWDDRLFPDASVTEAANNCRNPDNERLGPWCYTTDPNVRWEHCNVSFCDFTKNVTWSGNPIFPPEIPMPHPSEWPPHKPELGECRHTVLGKEYKGKMSMTESGLTCQHWDTQFPQSHINFHRHKFPDASVAEAANFCRNPDSEALGPWCYTTDPAIRWEHCYIPMCDCKDTQLGSNYGGAIAFSKSGHICEWWADKLFGDHSQVVESLKPEMFSEGEPEKAENFCRNPDDKPGGPWCFVPGNHPGAWEYCEVPSCEPNATTKPVKSCKSSSAGDDYRGTLSVTVSGRTCSQWYKQTKPRYYSHQFPDNGIRSASNYCRNPTRRICGAWCHTDDPAVPWEYCDVSMCGKTNLTAGADTKGICKNKMLGKDFTGKISTTVSGRTCQEWNSQFPHHHKYTQGDHFPEGSVSAAKNFCRNPNGEPCGPWCYTTDPEYPWDYCHVPSCQSKSQNNRGTHAAGSHAKNTGVSLAAILIPILLLLFLVIGLAVFLYIRRRRTSTAPRYASTPAGPFENPLYADPVQFKRLEEET